MKTQVLRGLSSATCVVGVILSVSTFVGLPDTLPEFATGLIMMVAGYGSFRWVSNTQSHNEQPSAKPSAILRFVGLLFIIVGSLLLLRGMFGVLSSAFLVMQGGLDQEGIIILLKVLVIGPVPGLLLVFAGRKLRMASLGHLAGASPN
ncbi:uncharacterized protein YjeT (DUF2065 family) [Marinobacter sp. MBR-99]|jgi:uncharacterized protein YjeT (DUF2065 family)|uniref:hypothetical protein n=1 Tax=Marinobacter sp. MBR-99 TaxID=3156461 RepID=UPI0033970BCC